MITHIAIYLSSVFVSSVSQILLKKSAGKTYQTAWKEYINPRVIIAYGMFFLSTLLTMYAYKFVPLSLGTLLEASGYIYIPILSYFFLSEKITKMKVVGAVFIIAGICCYALL